MAAPFEALIGAAGDVKELEYISALHQTAMEVRRDASIRAEDVRIFLMSRYGIEVTNEQVKNLIFAGLAGSNEDGECLDLMEIVAALLIPTLVKAAAQEQNPSEFPEDVVPTAPDMLDFVLKMILHDVTGDSSSKPLTPVLVKKILKAYGQSEFASDESLIQEMIAVAGGTAKGASANIDLNADSFALALTSDIQLYDVGRETCLATNVDTVFRSDAADEGLALELINVKDDEGAEMIERCEGVPHKNTIQSIDITAELYRSRSLVILLWATVVISTFAFQNKGVITPNDDSCKAAYTNYTYNASWYENSDAIICDTGSSVIRWVLGFFYSSAIGTCFVVCGSLGNSVDCHDYRHPIIGAFAVAVCVLLNYAFYKYVLQKDDSDSVGDDSVGIELLSLASLLLALATCSLHIAHAIKLTKPEESSCLHSIRSWLPDNTISAEARMRRAAARKISDMTVNALEIVSKGASDGVIATYFGQALQTYAKSGKKYIEIGGFQWGWKLLTGRKTFADEGIWLPARSVAGNISQYIVAFYTLLAGITFVSLASDNYDTEAAKEEFHKLFDKAFDYAMDQYDVNVVAANVSSVFGQFLSNQSLSSNNFGCDSNFDGGKYFDQYCSQTNGEWACDVNKGNASDFFCSVASSNNFLDPSQQEALLTASGMNKDMLYGTLRDTALAAADQTVENLYPSQKYMVVVPVLVATIAASMVAMYISVVFIPSLTTTILKFRCGFIPTLKDKNFVRYKIAPDMVSMLTGSMVWGTFVASFFVGGFVGLVVLFFVWQASAYFAQKLVAFLAGIVAVIIVRLLILRFFRFRYYQGMYRERPGAANLLVLVLEWANFLLTAGFVFIRMLNLIVAAILCVGRVDTPFLAPGVGKFGPIDLDVYPTLHRQDILIHEAHRHPYIEQLGMIYLMKLRYGEHFASRAGSSWRLIFVCALFPWLLEYRIQARPDNNQTFGDNEDHVHFPILQFVSMNNLRNLMNRGDEDNNEANVDPPGSGRIAGSPPSATETGRMQSPFARPLPGNSAVGEEVAPAREDDERIRELEAENLRLKAVEAEYIRLRATLQNSRSTDL